MATCVPNTVLAEGACFACLTPWQLEVAKTVLLCQILQASDPMASCDPNTLLAEGACFACLTPAQIQIVQAQLLCNIEAAGGGGGGSQEVYEGNGDPNGVVTPDVPGSPAIYNNLDVPGEQWWWVVADQNWI